MQKPSRGALEAVYGYVLRELLPKMVANQHDKKQKAPASAPSKEWRSSDEKKD